MSMIISGPRGLPIAGNLLAFRKDPLAFLTRASSEYGDVAHIRFGPSRHAYLISNPKYIKEILLTKQSSFKKAKGLQTARLVVGEGILTNEGKAHLRQRRLMQPAFHRERIASYGEIMVQETLDHIGTWRDGKTRDMHHEMMRLTLAIITRTMFGADVSSNADEIGHAIDVALQFVSRKATSILDIPLEVPTKNNREFQQAAELLDKTIYAIIEERRKHPDEERKDLLAMLLAERDEDDGLGMSDKQVRDEVMTIFVAGHETTANTLSWTWYLLAQHPEVEARFHQELETVLGGSKPTVEDIPRLAYVNQIVQESMRLYPAVWMINREVAKEVKIGGYTFKPGDTLMMSQYVMHRDPRFYDEPDRFKPERFADDLLKRNPQYAYFPFGKGPRMCIGNNFALMESAILLATIGQQFRLGRRKEEPLVEPEPMVTLRPKGGLAMTIQKR